MTAPAGPAADAALLDRVTEGCLAWLWEHRAGFLLPEDVATDADPNYSVKPLGELAELSHLVRTLHPDAGIRAAAGDLFAHAVAQTRGGDLFTRLIDRDPLATYPVEVYAAFAQGGVRHPEVDAVLATTTALRGWQVARGDHTRTLAVLAAERRLGLPQHADFATVFAHTALGSLPEPWTLDRHGAYGLTHDVFHLTDWGRDRTRMPPPLAAYLGMWLPCWLDAWFEEELWDLAGELLAVAACLPAARYDTAVWERLAAAQEPDGAVPEASPGTPAMRRMGGGFLPRYHSTLVTAFAATLARAADHPLGHTGGAQHTTGDRPAPESPESEVIT
ncbi:DUF6895 family protein [Streptomyces sp. NPDC050560]|uniref:DUF6895 family protein n=1 Tax=Streptomyces sp. NPDC050560 TaxID=3365630 RepID=UPI0037957354